MHYGPDTSQCGDHCLLELIRARAYQNYEARGRAEGGALADWLHAELEVKRHLGFEPVTPCNTNPKRSS